MTTSLVKYIDPLFSYTNMSSEGVDKSTAIGVAFTDLLNVLNELLPGKSREHSIMLSRLEEASMYAKKSLRNYKENLIGN